MTFAAEGKPTFMVTGASGFLGRYVCQCAATAGANVVAVDRRSDSGAGLLTKASVTTAQCDVGSREFREILERSRPSVILHLAGPNSVQSSLGDPHQDFRAGVLTTSSLLDAVRDCSAESHVVLASSAAVYGNTDCLPIDERVPPQPVSPYGYHKLMVELLGREYSTLYGLRVSICRIFSAYGPGLKRQIMWDVCTRALREPCVRLSGTGLETRDFMHGHDVAAALVAVGRQPSEGMRTVNIGSGQETTIAELASLLVEAVGTDVGVEFSGESRRGDPQRWCCDTTSLFALGFRPSVPLQVGVEQYVHWVRGLKGALR